MKNTRLAVLTALCFVGLLSGCAHPAGGREGKLVHVTGRVVRQDGTPFAGVWVMLTQEPKSSIIGPMVSPYVVVGVARSDEHGGFEIEARAVNRKRAALIARGDPRAVKSPGQISVVGASVTLDQVAFDGPNVIIVPDDFVPSTEVPEVTQR